MRPKNHANLVRQLEDRWIEVLDSNYVVKCCATAWDRLRRIVDANGNYIRPKDVDNSGEESDDDPL